MLANLDSNPVVQFLGLEGNNPYLKETALFFFCTSVCLSVASKKSGTAWKNNVHFLAISYVRCFTSYGFVLPLCLGQLPSSTWKTFDSYCWTLLVAALYALFIQPRFIKKEIQAWLDKPIDVAYAVIKANAAGAGFVLTAKAIPDSFVAPLVGTFLAVNGHKFLEHGVKALAQAQYDNDTILALFGGLLYWTFTTHCKWSALVSRVALVVIRIVIDYVSVNEFLENITRFVNDLLSGSAGKGSSKVGRSRSKTPRGKK
jgi:hypothetical protein